MLEAHQLAVVLLEFRLELGDGCGIVILQILLHLRLLFLEKGDARRHRGRLGGEQHDARLKPVSLGGPSLLCLMREDRRPRNLRL